MPIFRVTAVVETMYVIDVEAPSGPDACTTLGDSIRAGEATPARKPDIAHVSATRMREKEQ